MKELNKHQRLNGQQPHYFWGNKNVGARKWEKTQWQKTPSGSFNSLFSSFFQDFDIGEEWTEAKKRMAWRTITWPCFRAAASASPVESQGRSPLSRFSATCCICFRTTETRFNFEVEQIGKIFRSATLPPPAVAKPLFEIWQNYRGG